MLVQTTCQRAHFALGHAQFAQNTSLILQAMKFTADMQMLKIDSEARSRGIVCAQELGDHA